MAVFSTARLPALEAVSAAAFGSGLDIDTLASLVDKSLVRSDDGGPSQRFAMLLMIKEYAAERLAGSPEQEQAVRRAHAVYFSDFTRRLEDRLRGEERQSALEDLAGEIGNLRTAWRYWVEHGDLEQLFHLIDGLWALHEANGWYHAAIELASDALQVLATAERTPEWAGEELALRTSLARALMAVRGYGVEVEEAFKQVLALSEVAGTAAQRFPVLRALASYYIAIADMGRAVEVGRQLLELGEREGDESILIEGHYVFGGAVSFSGDLGTGIPHLERAIELYDPQIHRSSRFRLGPNTGVVARVALGLLLWQSGGLERAIAHLKEALDLARQLDHPYSTAYALYHNGFLALSRGRLEECAEYADELAQVAGRNDYLVWKTLATVLQGVTTTALGRAEEGLTMTEAAIDLYRGLTTPPVFWPLILSMRGQVHAMAGRPEQALALIDEAMNIAGPGVAQGLIFKGDFLRMLPEPDRGAAAEAYQAGVLGARAEGHHLIELQALTRLVGLRREMGTAPDGSDELASLYATFTEGFAEHDLLMAREMLG